MTTMTKEERDESIGKVSVETAIDIAVPPASVFEFWRTLENFSRFMQHIDEVRLTGNNRYRWRMRGPLGKQYTWEADVTHVEPDQRISWRSTDDAEIKQSGTVFFEPNDSGGTHLRVQLAYTPPFGHIGHAVATLLGENPRQQMDDDLLRCKQLLEDGITEVDGTPRTADDLGAVHKIHD